MNSRRLVFSLAFAAAAFSAVPAFPACGSGQKPTYRDVEAVRYEKTVCYGVCPVYQVAFSRGGLSYTGQANVARIGSYVSSETGKFDDVIALLSKFDFYSFKVKPVFVTDVPHFIVEVVRCGVTTRIDWPAMVWPGVTGTHDLRQLFIGLDRITNSVAWRKTPSRSL